MRMKKLGRTGLEVSEMGLGGLCISKIGGEFENSKAAMLRAIACGINYIDTAPTYANSEETVGRILKDISAPLIISTKLGGRAQTLDPQHRACLRRSFDGRPPA